MNQNDEQPHDVDVEKELLSAMLIRRGEVIPKVINIVSAEDFYRHEHRIIFQTILRMYEQGNLTNSLGIIEEINKTADKGKIDFSYLKSVELSIHTNAYAVGHAKIIKEKSELRHLMLASDELKQVAQLGLKPLAEIIAEHQIALDAINQSSKPINKSSFNEHFVNLFRRSPALNS